MTAVFGAALVFAVPAFGDSWGADQNQATVRVSPDLADRAAAARQTELASTHYAREDSAFATKRAVTRAVRPEPVRDDRFRLGASSIQAPVAATSSDRNLEWSQIGIGFGLGALLVIGLLLTVRTTRIRLPAH